MKNKVCWTVLLSALLIAPALQAQEEASLQEQIETLNQRVLQLERRLDALETDEVKQAIERVTPPARPGDSSDPSNWQRLKVGFDYADVRELLGEPVRIKKGSMEFWYYSADGLDGPYVKFLFSKANDWKAPAAD